MNNTQSSPEFTRWVESVDIVDYISQFVELEEKNGEYWGLSPFKEEKTPSFSVRRETGSFYDFSSGVAGNVLTFIRYYFHCSRRDSVRILKEYAGTDPGSAAPAAFLDAAKVCRRYLPPQKREKTPVHNDFLPDCMLRYEKSPEKRAVWVKEGISEASLDKFDVRYDAFANRLVYPIRDPSGKIVNLGGRTLDPAWKEKGLRKYSYYAKWGTMTALYGLWENREAIQNKREIIIFEGAKSVMLCDTWGIYQTAALLTSHLSPFQTRLLAGLGVRVVFALDTEVDVAKDRNVRLLARFVNVEYIRDTSGAFGEKDAPVDRGKEAFVELYKRRKKLRIK